MEFLLFCIRCCEQVMHKLTVSNLNLEPNTNVLKLYSDNNFSNMLDSLVIFLQPSKLDSLFKERQNKLKTEFLKDDYRQVVMNVLKKEAKIKGYEFKYLFKKPFDINNKNYEPIFSIDPQSLYDYFESMKFEIKYKKCYEETDWKLFQKGVFELNWK